MDRFFQNPTSNQIQECRRLPASVLRGAPTCDVRRVQTAGLGDENQEEHPERAEVEGQAGISSVLWWDPLSGSLLCWFLISNFPQTRFHRDVLLHSDGEHQPGAAIFHKTETAPMKEREKKNKQKKSAEMLRKLVLQMIRDGSNPTTFSRAVWILQRTF